MTSGSGLSAPFFIASGSRRALIGFAVALVWLIFRGEWRWVGWALVPLAMVGATTLLARVFPPLHLAASLVTLVTAVVNGVQFRGGARVAELVGAGGWLTAIVAARMLFGP